MWEGFVVNLSTNKLEPFGREIVDAKAWRLGDALTGARLGELWAREGILLFRRQALSEDELVAFSNQFGKAEIIVREDWKSDNRPEVIQISNMKDHFGNSIGGLGAGELDWHSDQSYVTDPATGSILYMVEMPSAPPMTYWANLQLAHAALSDTKQQRIANLHVVYDYLARQSTYDDEPEMSAELRQRTPRVTHPLVNVHPLTGDTSLYLDPTTAIGIQGWEKEAGLKLIRELCEHATQDAFVYKHEWQIGDIVMWDNGFLMHRRDAFDPAQNRLLKRTTLRLPTDRHIIPASALFEETSDSIIG